MQLHSSMASNSSISKDERRALAVQKLAKAFGRKERNPNADSDERDTLNAILNATTFEVQLPDCPQNLADAKKKSKFMPIRRSYSCVLLVAGSQASCRGPPRANPESLGNGRRAAGQHRPAHQADARARAAHDDRVRPRRRRCPVPRAGTRSHAMASARSNKHAVMGIVQALRELHRGVWSCAATERAHWDVAVPRS